MPGTQPLASQELSTQAVENVQTPKEETSLSVALPGARTQRADERFELASKMFQSGQKPGPASEAYLREAQKEFAALAKLDSNPEIAQASRYNLGFCHRALGEDNAAIQAFESYLQESKGEKPEEVTRVTTALANSYFDLATATDVPDTLALENAKRSYDKAIESLGAEADPQRTAELRFFRGESLRLLASTSENPSQLESEALADFAAVKDSGGQFQSLASQRMNNLHVARGDLKEALASVSAEKNPNLWASTRSQQALLAYESGDYATALSAASEALDVKELSSPGARLKLHIVSAGADLALRTAEGDLDASDSQALMSRVSQLREAVKTAAPGQESDDISRDSATALKMTANISLALLRSELGASDSEALLAQVQQTNEALGGLHTEIAKPYLKEIAQELLSVHYKSRNSQQLVAVAESLQDLGGLDSSVERYQYAESLLAIGRKEDALQEFDTLLAAAAKDESSASISALDDTSETNGIAARAGLQLVGAHTVAGDYAAATVALQTLEENFPTALNHAGKRYEVVFRASQSETLTTEAKNAMYEEYLADYPAAEPSTNLRRVLASEYLSAGRNQSALEHLEILEKGAGFSEYDSQLLAEAKLGLSRELLAQGENEKVGELLKELDTTRVSVRMLQIENTIDIAAGLREEGKGADAVTMLLSARELLPNSEQGVEAYIVAAETLLDADAGFGSKVRAEAWLDDAATEAGEYAEDLLAQTDESAHVRASKFTELRARALGARADVLSELGRQEEAAEIKETLATTKK